MLGIKKREAQSLPYLVTAFFPCTCRAIFTISISRRSVSAFFRSGVMVLLYR